jgi:hypothetical protein
MLPVRFVQHRRHHNPFLSGFNDAARGLAVYASQPTLPPSTQDSLPACWLGFGRAGLPPAGFHDEFQGDIGVLLPLVPGFA